MRNKRKERGTAPGSHPPAKHLLPVPDKPGDIERRTGIDKTRQFLEHTGQITLRVFHRSVKTGQKLQAVQHKNDGIVHTKVDARQAARDIRPEEVETGHGSIPERRALAWIGQNPGNSAFQPATVRRKVVKSGRVRDERRLKYGQVPQRIYAIRQFPHTFRHRSDALWKSENVTRNFYRIVFYSVSNAAYTCRMPSRSCRGGSRPCREAQRIWNVLFLVVSILTSLCHKATSRCLLSSSFCLITGVSRWILPFFCCNRPVLCQRVTANRPFPWEYRRVLPAICVGSTVDMRIASASCPAAYPHKYIL
jgi:hypothetical protein